jgi:hypothetical protein
MLGPARRQSWESERDCAQCLAPSRVTNKIVSRSDRVDKTREKNTIACSSLLTDFPIRDIAIYHYIWLTLLSDFARRLDSRFTPVLL